jgi:hypothetical protein
MPVAARADTRPPHNDVSITWNGEFDRAHGVRSGRGTMMDPYVISGWTIGNLSIKDTDRAIKIAGNTITGTLTLNWVGMDMLVRGNDIGDLRVNENNARWGDPTGGVITRNTFGTVGQLRHFDGTFSYNTVGRPQSGMMSSSYPDARGVNFDGFNGARFERNTIYGFVDARLHGHHHSTAFGMPSHMHADGPHSPPVDHTKRFHEVFIAANNIYTTHQYALAYLDTDHAANDRTANSETNPYLNAPHVHDTRVHITGNRLFGAGILIDVFNARDERHTGTHRGAVEIAGNQIALERDAANPLKVLQGIVVEQARDLSLKISANVIDGAPPIADVAPLNPLQTQGDGIVLDTIDKATVLVEGGRITNRQFGVRALQLTKSVRWTVRGVAMTGVAQPVSYDATVANSPARA